MADLDDLVAEIDEADIEPEDGGYPSDVSEELEAHLTEIDPTASPASNRGRKIIQRERERRSLELRKAGATYDQIAQQMGFKGTSGAYSCVQRGMASLVQEPASELRSLQYQRLNHLLLVTWPKASAGDERSIATCQSLMRDINVLMGTEAPKEVNINNNNSVLVIEGDTDEYVRQLKKMAGVYEEGEAQALLSGEPSGIIDAEIIEEDD